MLTNTNKNLKKKMSRSD